MLIATLSYSKLFEINLLQREESAAKSNLGSKDAFHFARADGIDTAITYRYWDTFHRSA